MNYLARSARRLKEQAVQILDANPTPSTSRPFPLFSFPEDTGRIITGTDADYRPTSTSTVSFATHSEDGVEFARFSGKTAADGYAAMRSKVEKGSFYGTPTWDVSPYKYLTLRMRGDARRYFINLQTESYLETDLYQHRVFLTSQGTGEWEDVMLKWNDFTLTNNGQIQEKQVAMDKYRLKTVGISVLDRLPGKFELDIQWIRAENGADDAAKRTDVDSL